MSSGIPSISDPPQNVPHPFGKINGYMVKKNPGTINNNENAWKIFDFESSLFLRKEKIKKRIRQTNITKTKGYSLRRYKMNDMFLLYYMLHYQAK